MSQSNRRTLRQRPPIPAVFTSVSAAMSETPTGSQVPEREVEDWFHVMFEQAFTKQGPRYRGMDGTIREHSLYGPCMMRMGDIYHAKHKFMLKPQALLMPEVQADNAAEESFSSTKAQDGDMSIDSMGGHVISHQRDTYIQADRKEIDLVVSKCVKGIGNEYEQVILLVVELKRDERSVSFAKALSQISTYLRRSLLRRNASQAAGQDLLGLLILGRQSIRLRAFIGKDGYPIIKAVVNRWLKEQAEKWQGVSTFNPQ